MKNVKKIKMIKKISNFQHRTKIFRNKNKKTWKYVKLIYNPYSGNGVILNNLDEIFRIYQENGYFIDIFRISFDSSFDMIKQDFIMKKYHHILISGGDGTINHVVNFLKKNSIDLPIGILPYGTANDFANLLNIPKEPKEACKKIINSSPTPIDIGVLNGDYFLNIASIGVFSEASHGISSRLKKLGKLGYYLNGVKDLAKFPKMKIKIQWDNGEIEDEVLAVLIFNGRTVGNLNLAKSSSLEDGYFDVLVVKPHNMLEVLEIFGGFITKDELKEKYRGIEYFQTQRIKIDDSHRKQHPSDIDGERGPGLPLYIECIKKGINVLGYKK